MPAVGRRLMRTVVAGELGASSVGGDGCAFDFFATHEVTIRGNRVAASWLTFERNDFLG